MNSFYIFMSRSLFLNHCLKEIKGTPKSHMTEKILKLKISTAMCKNDITVKWDSRWYPGDSPPRPGLEQNVAPGQSVVIFGCTPYVISQRLQLDSCPRDVRACQWHRRLCRPQEETRAQHKAQGLTPTAVRVPSANIWKSVSPQTITDPLPNQSCWTMAS